MKFILPVYPRAAWKLSAQVKSRTLELTLIPSTRLFFFHLDVLLELVLWNRRAREQEQVSITSCIGISDP